METGFVASRTTLPAASTMATLTVGVVRDPATASLGSVADASAAPGPALTAKGSLTTGVSPAADATSVYPGESRSSDRSPNRATPAAVETPVVPARVAPPGFAPSATVTAAPSIGFPNASASVTTA